MSKCPYCNTVLLSWSKFKDLKEKEGLGLAVCGFILNGLDHFMSGESRSQKQDSEYRTLSSFICIPKVLRVHNASLTPISKCLLS